MVSIKAVSQSRRANWKAMYNGINELIDDLMEHISLENNVLFPRALAGE